MDAVKQSEFCGNPTKRAHEVRCLSDIKMGTVFRASVGKINAKHVWLKTTDDRAICIGEPTIRWMPVGSYSVPTANSVYDYEELDAVIVIRGS